MDRLHPTHPLLATAGFDGVEQHQEPAYFHDLGLDELIERLCADHPRVDLHPIWWTILRDPAQILFRQGVFDDLLDDDLRNTVARFAVAEIEHTFDVRVQDMAADDRGPQHFHRARLFLEAAHDYCRAVVALADGLRGSGPLGDGLRAVGAHLRNHVGSPEFIALQSDAQQLRRELNAIRYCVCVRGRRITVGPYDGEPDLEQQLTATVGRFRQRPSESISRPEWETFAGTGLVDLVAEVHPEVFSALDRFCTTHADYLDPTIRHLDRDLQFYLAYLDLMAPLRAQGLPFVSPRVTIGRGVEEAHCTFDLTLARHLHADGRRTDDVVCNDLRLSPQERILVVTGPNGGGKTTFARTIGQLHHLAMIGCPVPGQDVRLQICDHIFTCFGSREDTSTTSGRLESELVTVRNALAASTPMSLFILNEPFSSTTSFDGVRLAGDALRSIASRGALGVCVTFLEELSTLDENTVSMVADVDPNDPTRRTFRIRRRAADGRAHAHAIARRYGLTFDQLVDEVGT